MGLVINRRDLEPPADPTRLLTEAGALLPGLRDRLVGARPVGPARCLGPLAHRATRLTAPGALLIGDAAGFLDPFTGEGIHAGLRGAELAADLALPALATGSSGQPDLDGYARDWSREFLPKWRLCTFLQYAVRHPVLAEWLVARLSRRPDLTSLLMAGLGDLVPAHTLGLARLLPRLLSLLASRHGHDPGTPLRSSS